MSNTAELQTTCVTISGRQSIHTAYHGPTNHRGSRIKVSCEAKTLWYPWDYALNYDTNHTHAVRNLLATLGWSGKYVGACSYPVGYTFVCVGNAS